MLAERTADFKRFSGDDMFALYRPLKTERDGQCSFEAEQAESAARFSGWMREKKPGYSLPEHQLSDAAWTLMKSTQPGEGLLSWTRISVRTPGELGVDRHTAPPAEMAETVKAAARFFGAGLVGIAPMDQAYVNLRQGNKDIVFENVEVPVVTETKFVIPTKMKWVVAIAIPMDIDYLAHAPKALGDAATGLGYSQSAFTAGSLADLFAASAIKPSPASTTRHRARHSPWMPALEN
jgi:hypothetical protein